MRFLDTIFQVIFEVLVMAVLFGLAWAWIVGAVTFITFFG